MRGCIRKGTAFTTSFSESASQKQSVIVLESSKFFFLTEKLKTGLWPHNTSIFVWTKRTFFTIFFFYILLVISLGLAVLRGAL